MCTSKYTRRTANIIIEAIEAGRSRKAAASKAGIHPSTLYDWQNEHPDFSDRVHVAAESCRGDVEECLSASAKKDPYLALKYLQSRHPEEWSSTRKQTVELVDSRTPDLSALTDEELAIFEALAAKVKPNGD